MRINEFQQEVNLLEIARRGKIDPTPGSKGKVRSFGDTFSREMARSENINFSKHARERLFSRGMDLTGEKLTELSLAIDKAALKGSRDTLILDDDAAYVVSVPSRTVITAFTRANLQEGVFTSIDSAVIL
jgi:flagellar operon protein